MVGKICGADLNSRLSKISTLLRPSSDWSICTGDFTQCSLYGTVDNIRSILCYASFKGGVLKKCGSLKQNEGMNIDHLMLIVIGSLA